MLGAGQEQESGEGERLLKGREGGRKVLGLDEVLWPAQVGHRLLSCSQLDGGLPEGGAAFPSGAGGEPPEWSAPGQAGPLFCTLCGSTEEDL